jgi:hypothetical protein
MSPADAFVNRIGRGLGGRKVYSWRSASIGSVRAARRAGMKQARSATVVNRIAAATNVNGSAGSMPKRNAPPFAPGDLTALPLSRKRIQLTWTDPSMREQGFAIERADDNTGFKQIAQVGANVSDL